MNSRHHLYFPRENKRRFCSIFERRREEERHGKKKKRERETNQQRDRNEPITNFLLGLRLIITTVHFLDIFSYFRAIIERIRISTRRSPALIPRDNWRCAGKYNRVVIWDKFAKFAKEKCGRVGSVRERIPKYVRELPDWNINPAASLTLFICALRSLYGTPANLFLSLGRD